MHEYSIIASLLQRVERESTLRGANRVHRLKLQIGEYAGVEVDLLKIAFDTFRERTICESAELVIDWVGAAWACSRCGRSIARGAPLRCEPCARPATMVRGDEIILERIEMET